MQVTQVQMRNFHAKKGRGRPKKNSDSEASDAETVERQVETPAASTPSTPFSVGDIKVIESTPDHKPPTAEDTIEGRYAGVLFTSASQ